MATIEFIGRMDNQIKIRGFRIELGEIEERLLKHENIKEAVVMAKEEQDKNKYICAYLAADREIPVGELRQYLGEELPDYMLPSYFIQLDKLPLNQNGKIDRTALPEPEGKINTGTAYVAPRNKLEEKLVEIWKELLGVETIGVYDNFFELGRTLTKSNCTYVKDKQGIQCRYFIEGNIRKSCNKQLGRVYRKLQGKEIYSNRKARRERILSSICKSEKNVSDKPNGIRWDRIQRTNSNDYRRKSG